MKNQCPDCFSVLATRSRVKIYKVLEKGGKSVGEIVKIIGLRQPTISYHLSLMERKGLLKRKKQGKTVYYHLSSKCPVGGLCIL